MESPAEPPPPPRLPSNHSHREVPHSRSCCATLRLRHCWPPLRLPASQIQSNVVGYRLRPIWIFDSSIKFSILRVKDDRTQSLRSITVLTTVSNSVLEEEKNRGKCTELGFLEDLEIFA